jgi:hypothetical protein
MTSHRSGHARIVGILIYINTPIYLELDFFSVVQRSNMSERQNFSRTAAAIATLLALSGCAAGSSMSISQSPISFVVDGDGGYDVASRSDGTTEALAENGSFESGVPGYTAVGGNALLPVSVPIAAIVGGPGQANAQTVTADVAGLTAGATVAVTQGQAAVTAGAGTPVIGANADASLSSNGAAVGVGLQTPAGPLPEVGVALSAPGTSATAALRSPGTDAAIQTIASPATATPAVSRTLTTTGPVLGVPTTAQALGGGATATNSGVLAAIAAEISKHCAVPGCK